MVVGHRLSGEDVDVHWQAFLRRFDIEHLFRLMKQTLGWTRPRLRTPEAGDRWTWLIIAAHTQLRLLRGAAAADLRRPRPTTRYGVGKTTRRPDPVSNARAFGPQG